MTSISAETRSTQRDVATHSIETRTSWIVAGVSLGLLGISFGSPWITSVGLKQIAAEMGGSRSVPALAASLAWFGTAAGGLVMGPVAQRFGIRWTVIFGALMITIGLLISALGAPWQLYLGHGVFIGLLGNAGLNAPLYVYASRWFDRRRGSAMAIIGSGGYLAGFVWPTIFERSLTWFGWRWTMVGFAVLTSVVIVPVAAIMLKPPPEMPHAGTAGFRARATSVLGWPPNVVYGLLCLAAFMCCVTMSMPQAHLVALCSDLGISPTVGAAMLSLLLGSGLICRQIWGWISDRVGGLVCALASSAMQAAAMVGFLLTQDVYGLFAVSAAFGIGFSALVPAYVLAIRDHFPLSEAHWRVPGILLLTGTGMATGGWLGGYLYDIFGYYGPAFAAGVGFNLGNLALLALLVFRQHSHPATPTAPVVVAA